jgi:hypothetical protein
VRDYLKNNQSKTNWECDSELRFLSSKPKTVSSNLSIVHTHTHTHSHTHQNKTKKPHSFPGSLNLCPLNLGKVRVPTVVRKQGEAPFL